MSKTGQDDARRALADELDRLIIRARQSETPIGFNGSAVADLGYAVARNRSVILTALRASPERAAENMRERAARAAEWYAYKPVTGDVIAAAIRALRADPLPQETGESDG